MSNVIEESGVGKSGMTFADLMVYRTPRGNTGSSGSARAEESSVCDSGTKDLTARERAQRRKMELQNGDTVEDLVGKKERPDRKTRIDRERHKMSLLRASLTSVKELGRDRPRSVPWCTPPGAPARMSEADSALEPTSK